MVRRTSVTVAVVLVGLSISLGPSRAVSRQAKPEAGPKDAPLNDADRSFMAKAAQAGVAEIALGQLALRRGESEEVKQFGQHMVSDYSAADDKLRELAVRKGMLLPVEMGARHSALMRRWSKLPGAQFDREYIGEQVMDHVQLVSWFESELSQGRSREVKTWAEERLPVLQEHTQAARDVAVKLRERSRPDQ